MAQQIAEGTVGVQGPVVSKSSSSQKLSSYMLRRVNIPGPNLGFPYVLTFGPKTVTATTAGQLVIALPSGVRPLAAGWYCGSTGGASTVRFVKATTAGGTASGASSIVGTQSAVAGVPLDSVPYGVAYSKDDVSTYTVTLTPLTTTTESIGTGDPEWIPTGVSAPRTFTECRFATASTVADFSYWVLVVPTRHCNTLSSSD